MIRYNVEDVRSEFADALYAKDYVIDKTGVKTLEILNASFIANEETIFGSLNHEYIQKELNWYYSLSLSVYNIEEPIPEIWKQVADKNGLINSNYGWCIFHGDNFNQYQNALDELSRNLDSRRAIMIYTRPNMWQDYNRDGMSDFMCTNTVQYLYRDKKLHAVVNMRSNDVVFGYRNDYAWQKHVLDCMCVELELEAGNIFWNVGSLHVYERHFNLVEEYMNDRNKHLMA